MKTIAELRALRAKAIDDASKIIDAAKNDKGEPRDLTADETKAFDGLKTQADTLAAEIKTAEEVSARVTWLDNEKKMLDGSAGRKSAPDAGDKSDDAMPRITSGRVRVKNFSGAVGGKSAEERAYRFGHFCLAQLSKSMPGRYNFEKSLRFAQDQFGKLHSGGDNSAGGYLIPEEFSTDQIALRETYGVMRRLLRGESMTSDTKTIPRRTGGLTMYAVGEGAAGTESTKAWDQVKLIAKDWMVLSRYTAQLNQDAVINIGDDLAGEIAYAGANKEDDTALNGDATSTYHGIVGVRTKLSTTNGVDDGGGLVLGTATTWAGTTLADFDNVVGRLPQYADTQNACWVTHRAFYHGVMARLETAAGGVTANEIQQGNRRPRPLFKGYPVEISQLMPSATAVSSICALFGDFTQAGAFGDRQQEAIAFSEHANIGGQSLFERNEIGIRGTSRWDINIHDIGSSTVAGPVIGLITKAS